jgi:hypothetical protein
MILPFMMLLSDQRAQRHVQELALGLPPSPIRNVFGWTVRL